MSKARTAANRKNAKLSTGPRTPEGKERAGRNSTKHGLTSAQVVLPNESREEYEQLRDTIIAGHAPANKHEHALALVVAETFWRRQRLYRLESAFMSFRMTELSETRTDPNEALIQIFTDPAEMTRARLLLRYISAAERAYRTAVAELEKLQASRREGEAERKRPTLASTGTEASDEFYVNSMLTLMESKSPAKDGFVSQAEKRRAELDKLRALREIDLQCTP